MHASELLKQQLICTACGWLMVRLGLGVHQPVCLWGFSDDNQVYANGNCGGWSCNLCGNLSICTALVVSKQAARGERPLQR